MSSPRSSDDSEHHAAHTDPADPRRPLGWRWLVGRPVRSSTVDVSDHEQIRALLARYNFAIDAGDAAAWTACFTADGVFESTGVESEPVRVEARDLQAFATRQHEINQGRGRHWTSNELIEVAEDGVTATMSCYLLAVTTGRRIAATGIYHDRLRKDPVDGRWRFALRHVDVEPPPDR